ncbi:putative membrane protein [Myxococcus xanthus DK 1622]|uniref:Membrane protein n=1 Tax=Myxococcus xanthus (strain DK1622) TaxID=246197 RepID=Q1DBE9_MYXXD|nr:MULTISPECIES: hypothetical protein [Myxococcus]ABF87663.1 putative membrane protein [Myxococcus xanthus DK 1622]NOJ54663.1 hypothetical protein [Myxococcus xanthus]QPM81375.1 hypothetical protein I5Q59_08815 [Myxococcus xanthus]QVW70433.1 hypothetical protein JTM82_13110 [Myxococcus xanthus DZ2]QZZ49298.1 hypothetical protein MyxoNM_08810 [Myxococcus xanthus]
MGLAQPLPAETQRPAESVRVSPPSSSRAPYIAGPLFDWAFFLLPPLLALGLGIVISGTPFSDTPVQRLGQEKTWAGLMVGSLIHAHLVAVFFRSHGNPAIFRLYPLRFILVPVLAWAAIRGSAVVAAGATVLATFWDVWHSGLQTFGLARIYDRNQGNPPEVGRQLDFWLNHLLYAGPILAGATMLDHFNSFESFDGVGMPWLASVPARMTATHRAWTLGVVAVGGMFLLFYIGATVRLLRQGHRPSFHKAFLLVTTGACSIYTWGFNSWGEAFFIMNLLHAIQYLALVWAMEGERLRERLRLKWRWLALALFLGTVLTYGVWAELLDASAESLWALTLVVSLMHFWYDGFIWSVARRQV